MLGGLAWGSPATAVVEMPFRAEGSLARGVGSSRRPAHWLLLYERYKPERAALLAPLVAPCARAAAGRAQSRWCRVGLLASAREQCDIPHMAAIDEELVEHTTAAALEEKAKLKKHFGRFDMLFFLLCTLVGLDTLGAVASNGAQGFTWLVFLASSSSSPTRC